MESGSNFDSSRAELFEALGHPTRVRILRSLEDGPAGFAKLKREIGIESSGQLQFHLGKLGGLVTTDSEGSYALTDEGREAIRVLKTVPTDFATPGVRHSAAGRNGWTRSPRVFQVISVVLLVFIAVFGFAYYSQSMQVGSLNSQVQSLSSEAHTLQVGEEFINYGTSVVIANKVSVFTNCTASSASGSLELGGTIVAFQANYSGYLVVKASDFTNSSKAYPFLSLGGGIYPTSWATSSTPISFTTQIPVSPPGYAHLVLGVASLSSFGSCVPGSWASGTFTVTYYY